MSYDEQRSSKEAPEPEPSRSEEGLRVIKDHANNLREILKRLRKLLNKGRRMLAPRSPDEPA